MIKKILYYLIDHPEFKNIERLDVKFIKHRNALGIAIEHNNKTKYITLQLDDDLVINQQAIFNLFND